MSSTEWRVADSANTFIVQLVIQVDSQFVLTNAVNTRGSC